MSEVNDFDLIIQKIKTRGLKATKSRIAVLHCLESNKHPLSPKNMQEKIKNTHNTSMDMVSIYRILETFQQNRLIHYVHPAKGFMLCQHLGCKNGAHILTYCQTCKQSQEVEVPFEMLDSMKWYLKTVCQFTPKDHFFQMEGYCNHCKPE